MLDVIRPHQAEIALLLHLGMREEEFCLEVFQRRRIEAELPLQQPVGHPFAAAQQLDHPIEYLVQVHAQPLRCRVVAAVSHPVRYHSRTPEAPPVECLNSCLASEGQQGPQSWGKRAIFNSSR